MASVVGADAADLSDICRGVTSAHGFLARFGLVASEPVAIEVSGAVPKEAGPTAAGCHIERLRRVYRVPYRVFQRNRTWFGVPISRELYRALATHEAAHAIAACNFKIANPTIQAKEYLAYVTMFSVMPAGLRRQALHRTTTQGFASLDRFTPVLYSFDPMRFGAEAYRHFSAASDQQAVVDGILDGRALLD